jgi:quinoprotein glucose dehydrogenase
LGGTFNTATGVLVSAAGQDRRLRLYESLSGRLLAEYPLPAVSVATPMTFRAADNRQYVVVVAGNQDERLGRTGNTVVAFRISSDPSRGSAP